MGTRVSCSFTLVFPVLFFSLSLQVVHEFHGVTASAVVGNETDWLALLEFKSKITEDPFGVLSSWNGSHHFCQWHGVTCGRKHQRVTILDLRNLRLAGSISPHVGNLSFLRVLYLPNNNFTHEIPSEIGRLLMLQSLNLSFNSIGGKIPANISSCSNLIRISLRSNQLVGKIPSEFGSMSNLEFLSTRENNLTGSIPSSLGNLSSIDTLSLSYNYLEGSIPYTLGFLNNLLYLYLAINRLSGKIPSSIFNISSIEEIDLVVNQIQGHIPLDFGITLPNLRVLGISANPITGRIPLSLSNASKLEDFQASENNLTGDVPYLDKLQRLRRFLISSNNLGSGGLGDLNFICSLINATNFQRFAIDDNNFGGLIPACITNLSTTLAMLVFDSNKIFGSIPIGIGKFVKLERLVMQNNQLSGTIPYSIGELQNLVVLRLFGNKLSGNIPLSIGSLKVLIQLDLSENFLQGKIPSSLGQCERLLLIDLSHNNLSGSIPPQVIGLSSLSIYLNLSRNHLSGSLPIEVGNLKNLGILDISSNLLSGEIPDSLGSCTSLEKLYMHDNIFQGPIPSSFSSLKGLEVLDLSQNNLSGEIPKFLGRFTIMQKLNLSYNDFGGMIPTEGIFNNESATSVSGNNKLCGGLPEFQLPNCNLIISKQGRYAKKLVLVIVSGCIGLLFALFFLFLCWVRKKKDKHAPNSLINPSKHLSYQNLCNATDRFSSVNLIGAGSFGSVYKGIIEEGKTIVAVKVFNLLQHGASRSFIGECEALRNIRHRNLVKVITACSGVDYQGNDFKALVYEFMPNGSLEEWLHPITKQNGIDEAPRNLNLIQRLNIAIDVACALSYLHYDCQPPTAHCDLKPSNILLDDAMTAHVGDFGLVRFLHPTHKHTSSIGIKGSIGYIAPEYGLGNDVSIQGDVYSYGILLLEMVTGKKPTNFMFTGYLNLHKYARMALSNHVIDILDPVLLNVEEDLVVINNQRQRQLWIDNSMECLVSLIKIGVACSMESSQDRMNINNVVHGLQSTKKILLQPGTV